MPKKTATAALEDSARRDAALIERLQRVMGPLSPEPLEISPGDSGLVAEVKLRDGLHTIRAETWDDTVRLTITADTATAAAVAAAYAGVESDGEGGDMPPMPAGFPLIFTGGDDEESPAASLHGMHCRIVGYAPGMSAPVTLGFLDGTELVATADEIELDERQANREGWGFFESDTVADDPETEDGPGTWQLCRIDSQDDEHGAQLASDDEAWAIVRSKAAGGSVYHLAALAWLRLHSPVENARIMTANLDAEIAALKAAENEGVR